jgi:hypothetical protein
VRSSILALLLTALTVGGSGTTAQTKPSSSPETAAAAFLRSPLRFEPRHDPSGAGQFVARGLGYAVYLSPRDASVVLRNAQSGESQRIRLTLTGGRVDAQGIAREALPGVINYLSGSDPKRWRTNITAFARVEYHDVYPGIDLTYYGNQGQLEYDFIVRPGADASRIAFAIDGARSVEIDRAGNLVLTTDAGTIVHRAPVIYQDVAGVRTAIDGQYVIGRDEHVAFRIGDYDRQRPLVIDPVLSYASYLGGSQQERAHGVASASDGSTVIVGETFSADFPILNAEQPQKSGFGDAMVVKLTPTGDALVYATYLGGTQGDSANAVDVDVTGAAYVTGTTASQDFPTRGAFQAQFTGTTDAFVAKLDAAGGLVYSTRLGGALADDGLAIAVDAAGRAHVGGSTWSADFPVMNALQPSLGGSPILRTTDAGATWSSLANGPRAGVVQTFAFDPANPNTGYAGTDRFIFKTEDGGNTWTPLDRERASVQVFQIALGAGSPAVAYAATNAGYLRSRDGGATWEALPVFGLGNAVAVSTDSASTVYVGTTFGSPSGVYVSTDGGDNWSHTGLDGEVWSLAVSGSTVYAATANGFFMRTGDQGGWVPVSTGSSSPVIVVAADPANPSVAYAGSFDGLFTTTTSGATWTPALQGVAINVIAVAPSVPSTLLVSSQFGGAAISYDAGSTWQLTSDATASAAAFHPQDATIAYMGQRLGRDGFMATVSADGARLEQSTFFGGSSGDEITDLAVGADGGVYVTGTTTSPDLPLRLARQSSPGGLQDAFIARVGPDGGLAYSTYLGGSGYESGSRIAVDAMGQAHVAGVTFSNDFPVANAAQPQPGGGFADVFVSVLTLDGGAFVYSTYLGGNNMETNSGQSYGPDLAVLPGGDTFVTGTTMSANFPTTADALQRVHAGGQNDAFLVRYDAAGTLTYGTFLGGKGDDYAQTIALDPDGSAVIGGYTTSTDFPMRGALQPVSAGSDEGFVAKIASGTSTGDVDPPVTSVTTTGTAGLAGWYRSAVVVTLSPNDTASGSGIALVQYSLDGGPWITYSSPFTVSTQGFTHVAARATDLAGNVEVPAEPTTIKIDTAAPIVAIVSPQAKEYLFSDTLTVTTTVTDATSGAGAPAALSLDGVALSGNTIDLSQLALGPHTLTASAADVAGNAAQASVVFRVVSVIDTIIRVPSELPTIQAAIDAAVNGETVLVAPGTYVETINFRGKSITVTSEQGPEQTIIDGAGRGPVVTFGSRETRSAVLSGFTIRGGLTTHAGGGILIGSSSPTIRGNVITANRACTGVGVYSSFGSPLIEHNRITGNTIHGCTGGWGIGVYIGGNSAAEVIGNEITDNTGEAATGGGLALFAAGSALVRDNLIARNATSGPLGCGFGGGIATANFSSARIINNVIVGNTACIAAGIQWGGSTGSNLFVNNTVADNEASIKWPGVYVSGFDSRNQLHNNIFSAKSGPAFYCENAATLSSPVMKGNDIYTGQGAAYGGTCTDQSGLNGNLSADPQFVNAAGGDYRLRGSSPAVDSGNDAAPSLPSTDVAGFARIADGNADGATHVDMGAFEYRNRAPVVFAGNDQTVDAGAGCQGPIVVSGTASDADGDALTYIWTTPLGTMNGPAQALVLPPGVYTLVLTVDDGNGGSASDSMVVTVRDTDPPAISAVAATPSRITKTNHEMVPVVLAVSASDGCGGPVSCRIVSVSSSESVDGTGDGDTSPDWEITGPLTLKLRGERSAQGSGRIYTITVECLDAAGNRSTSTVTVTVSR